MTRAISRTEIGWIALSGIAVLGCYLVLGLPSAKSTRIGAAARSRACRSFQLRGTRYSVTIKKGRVTCRTARRVLRAFMSGKGTLHGPPNGPAYKQTWTLDGWTCGHGAGGGGCIRHGTDYKNARDFIVAEFMP
jgi:hypothetical protein